MDQERLKETVLSYLETHNSLSLATLGAEGVHAAAVFYVNRGFSLYFVSSAASRHGSDLSENPEVAATINEDYSRWRQIKGIQLTGRVHPVGGIWENSRIALMFVKKFPDVADFFHSPGQLGKEVFAKVEGVKFYELVPRKIYFTDNERGFGHREELLLDAAGRAGG